MKFLPLILLCLGLTACDKIASALNGGDPTPTPAPEPATPGPLTPMRPTPPPHNGDWMWQKDGHNPLERPAQRAGRAGQVTPTPSGLRY